jgi:hypothetical protein
MSPILQSALFELWRLVSRVGVQAPWTPGSPPGLPQGPAPEAVDASGGLVLVSAVVVLLLLVGAGVKFYDLRQKREQQAAVIQSSISDALMNEPALFRFPITPTVRIPLWRGSPIEVTVAGSVPEQGLRQIAMNLVHQQALKTGKDYHVDDRISVDKVQLRRAA